LARVDSQERGPARLLPLGCDWERSVPRARAGFDRIRLHPVGGDGPRRGDEGVTRANHEPFTPNKTSIAGARTSVSARWVFVGRHPSRWAENKLESAQPPSCR
jgi:hypothetical protein